MLFFAEEISDSQFFFHAANIAIALEHTRISTTPVDILSGQLWFSSDYEGTQWDYHNSRTESLNPAAQQKTPATSDQVPQHKNLQPN